MSIGVVVPTWHAEHFLPYCIPPLKTAACNPRIVVIDSSSSDKTVEVARILGVDEVDIIEQRDFNHGVTRERGRRLLGTDIAVMVTQDVRPLPGALDKLVEPLIRGTAAVAYGRQLPHEGAGFFEAFSRYFNYPPHSYCADIGAFSVKGAQLFFCSNAFAGYSSEALDGVGGFSRVLFGEDTVAAAKLLRAGYNIAYVAEAMVHHSHSYTLHEEFRRHFDIGFSRKSHEELLGLQKGDNRRGGLFAKKMLQTLLLQKPALIPYACCHLATKWLGYHLGRCSDRAPIWVKRSLSAHPTYWQ